MVLTEQCLGPLHLRVLQNTITTTSNLECLLHTGDLCLRECMQLRLYVCGHVDVMVEGGLRCNDNLTVTTDNCHFWPLNVSFGVFVRTCHLSVINFSTAFAARCS